MNEALTLNDADTPEIRRGKIIAFDKLLRKTPGVTIGNTDNCPLTHHFTDGIYTREIFIPAGTILTGKIHKHDHPNFLIEGEVEVITEGKGREYLKAPLFMISPKGTKRALRAITDVKWITIHANKSNTHDLKKIENFVIAKSYKELNISPMKKLLNFLKIKNL